MRRPEFFLIPCLLLSACVSDGADKPATRASTTRLSSDGQMNLSLAQSYLDTGKLDKAVERAEAALRSDPGSADVHALRALIHERQGEADKADREFERALKIAPGNGQVLNAHAVWLCEHGKTDQADREFVRALADPSYRTPIQALANAGKCALSAGQLAKAEDYLRRALVFGPEERTLLYLLADLELRQGKSFEAKAFIQRRDALGADAKTLDLAARIEDAEGNAQGAARYRQRLQTEFPEFVPTGEGARSP